MRLAPLLLLLSCTPDKTTGGETGSADTPPDTDTSAPTDDSASPEDTAGPEDADGDGFATDVDCDDNDPDIYPGVTEICDGIDNDCDGLIDDEDDIVDPITQSVWFGDADDDGYGDESIDVRACDAPDGYVADRDGIFDCDDTDPDTYPSAPETDCADPHDYNCDGSVGYRDNDSDGFAACEDCNDMDAAIHPLATEICDHIDNNCDSNVDDEDHYLDFSTRSRFYADTDGDGFGDEDAPADACNEPEGYVDAEDEVFDCNDDDAEIHPDADEVCDLIDNDCDDLVDDLDPSRVGGGTYYIDHDSDGYGSADYTLTACETPDGYTTNADDCDDLSATIHPGAVEHCDLVDNDCDGSIDELGSIGMGTWYADDDLDGFGIDEGAIEGCDPGAGFSETSGDCDDGRAGVNPDAEEVCDGIDNDCSGEIDGADAAGSSIWYVDADGDTHGDADSAILSCDPGAGFSETSGDCDDDSAGVNPDAEEVCDGIDNDCSGEVDGADAADSSIWYVDADGDTHGDPDSAMVSCDPGVGHSLSHGDCDDTRPDIHPDAIEICDGLDNNCDGSTDGEDAADVHTWYLDADLDGHGAGEGLFESCDPGLGYADISDDCDDARSDTYPGATELCDALDNDCDTVIDNGLSLVTHYRDVDEDGFGDATITLEACAIPEGYAAVDGDCHDGSAVSYPGATEACEDGLDNNCDGAADCDDLDDCRETTASCWVCGDGYLDPGEECDDGDTASGDGCSSGCVSEMDLSGLETSWSSAGRTVYVWKSNSSAPLSSYDNFCEERGLAWFTPDSAADAQKVITDLYARDSHHTWIITKNNTTSSPTWGGYSVTVDSPGCVATSSGGFSGIRKWSCSMCDPESHGYTRCWDSSHSYDWLVCEDPS